MQVFRLKLVARRGAARICAVMGFCVVTAFFAGCVGSSGGGNSGTISGAGAAIRGNELRTVCDVPLERVWEATKLVAGELGWTVRMEMTQKSSSRAVMTANDREGRVVVVLLEARSARTTEIRVRVGEATSSANAAQAEVIYRRLTARL